MKKSPTPYIANGNGGKFALQFPSAEKTSTEFKIDSPSKPPAIIATSLLSRLPVLFET